MDLKGVYQTQKKNGDLYFRSSITFRNKHISLGSYAQADQAHKAYLKACAILLDHHYHYLDLQARHPLSFEKWIVLHNFRDNGLYIKNPVYMHRSYLSYFLDASTEYKFDVDDLFYLSVHKLFKKEGYLFTNDYGMQVNVLNRFGIKNFAVLNQDYAFLDGDATNLTRSNIEIYNTYHGVVIESDGYEKKYLARINVLGRYHLGRYKDVIKAAVAFNKAADFLESQQVTTKTYPRNYISGMKKATYLEIYTHIQLPKKLLDLATDVG